MQRAHRPNPGGVGRALPHCFFVTLCPGMPCCTIEKSAPNTTRVMGSDIWFRCFVLFGDHRSSAPSDVLLHVSRAGNGGGVLAVDHRILLRQLAAVRDCCAKLKTSARARVCANCRSSGESVDHNNIINCNHYPVCTRQQRPPLTPAFSCGKSPRCARVAAAVCRTRDCHLHLHLHVAPTSTCPPPRAIPR